MKKPTKSDTLISRDMRDIMAEEYTFCSLCNRFLTIQNAEKHSKACSYKDSNRLQDLYIIHLRERDVVRVFCGYGAQQPLSDMQRKSPEARIMVLNEELQKIHYLLKKEITKQKDFSTTQ